MTMPGMPRLSYGRASVEFTGTPAAGPYNNLTAIGVNSGAIGAASGSTSRLQLDTTKLQAALNADPAAVANLLDSATGAIKPLIDRVNAYAGIGGIFFQEGQQISQDQGDLVNQEADVQSRIDAKRTALEAKYATTETLLSSLQGQSNQLSSQTSAYYSSSGSSSSSSG